MGQLSQQFAIVQIDEVMTGGPPIIAALVVEPMSDDRIRMAQEDDIELQDLRDRARQGEAVGFYITEGGTLKTSSGRTIVPCDAELRTCILDEAHQTQYMFIMLSSPMKYESEFKINSMLKNNIANYWTVFRSSIPPNLNHTLSPMCV
jgi:hypothetical protein